MDCPPPPVHPCISIKHDAFHRIQNRQSLSPGCHALVIVLLFDDESRRCKKKKNLENCQSLLRRGPFLNNVSILLSNEYVLFFLLAKRVFEWWR